MLNQLNLSRFGRRLRNLRLEKKLTQADVAREVGVGQTAVSQWEIGSTAPTLANIYELARLFDVTAGELLDGVTDDEELAAVAG